VRIGWRRCALVPTATLDPAVLLVVARRGDAG
jgi:hypothetical protein